MHIMSLLDLYIAELWSISTVPIVLNNYQTTLSWGLFPLLSMLTASFKPLLMALSLFDQLISH